MNKFFLPLSLLLLAFLGACQSKSRDSAAVDDMEKDLQAVVVDSTAPLHKVTVNEILQGSRYTYLNVTEDGNPYWIVLPKKEVEKGATYYYRGGLKKTNFKSAEHDRVFEEVYLVSDVSKNPNMFGVDGSDPQELSAAGSVPEDNSKIEPPPGGITIAELFANSKKYNGQTVRVKGRCVKLNNMIMDRNWVHIEDGSLENSEDDLTVTTTENVALGAIVAFEGRITLNKDFGAGYKYDIIMEDARLLQ